MKVGVNIRALFLAGLLAGSLMASPPPVLWPKHVEIGRFPLLAAKALVSGTVVVRCHLDKDGRVVLVEVVQGHPLLAEASAENSLAWTFFTDKSMASESPTVELTYEYKVEEAVSPVHAFYSEVSIDFPYRILVETRARPRNPRPRR